MECLLTELYSAPLTQQMGDSSATAAQVRVAFAERRKMLRNTLQSRFTAVQIADALAAADIPLNARPQQLDLQQYLALWQHLTRTRAAAQSLTSVSGASQHESLHLS